MSDNFEILLKSFIRAQNCADRNFTRLGNKIAHASVNDLVFSLSTDRLNQAITRLSEAGGKPRSFVSWLAKTIEILAGNYASEGVKKAGKVYYLPAERKILSFDRITSKFYLLDGAREIITDAEFHRATLPENLLAVQVAPQAKKASAALKAAQKTFAKALCALAKCDGLDAAIAAQTVAYLMDSGIYSQLSDKDKTTLAVLRRKANNG